MTLILTTTVRPSIAVIDLTGDDGSELSADALSSWERGAGAEPPAKRLKYSPADGEEAGEQAEVKQENPPSSNGARARAYAGSSSAASSSPPAAPQSQERQVELTFHTRDRSQQQTDVKAEPETEEDEYNNFRPPRRPRARLLVADDDENSSCMSGPEGSRVSSSPLRRTPPAYTTKTGITPTSPQNYRSRARVRALRSQIPNPAAAAAAASQEKRSRYFGLKRLPYLTEKAREEIIRGVKEFQDPLPAGLDEPLVFHVDFSSQEIAYMCQVTQRVLGLPLEEPPSHEEEEPPVPTVKDLSKLLKKRRSLIPKIAEEVNPQRLRRRGSQDVRNFLTDVIKRGVSILPPLVLSIDKDEFDKRGQAARETRLTALLAAREMIGQTRFDPRTGYLNMTNELKKCREDGLELRTEWTNCAGDIATIVWTSGDAFICGTTAHSDSRNQQYNKPGNLVLGSTSLGTLKAYPDHRIVRPLITEGENASNAMRETQDPWLYSSVVSSDYDAAHGRAYTSGFDRAVKVWKVDESGSSMEPLGTWHHGGNVNFVVASKHESGMVATAADVAADAVRIYRVDEDDISGSSYRSYSCSRIVDAEGNPIVTDKWAYFPAAIRWGLSRDVRHLVLVGYSPRSCSSGDDNDIPEDRRNSGEICLWDGLTGERWRITTGTVQNVFEVAWHPSQPSFIAATSPVGTNAADNVFTQIRIFRPSSNEEFGGHAFGEIKVLDCFAADINELAILPNSFSHVYVAAGCTDGKTYIWDTAQGDKPLHILSHGAMIEEQAGNVISVEDTGVKFVAWGTTPDRLYTGSSDGVVKVWDVRSSDDPLVRSPLVRDLLECPAPVSYGAFSPDHSKLVVGDASGRVFLLSVDAAEDESEESEESEDGGGGGGGGPGAAAAAAVAAGSFTTLSLPGGSRKTVRRPRPVMPHAEPPPPTRDAEGNPLPPRETGVSRAGAYLASGQLRLHGDPTVGAVQGPRYAQTGLFRREAHYNGDPAAPLDSVFERLQQENYKMFRRGTATAPQPARQPARRPVVSPEAAAAAEAQLRRNLALDLDVESLPPELKLRLELDGADLHPDEPDYGFTYEELPADLGLDGGDGEDGEDGESSADEWRA